MPDTFLKPWDDIYDIKFSPDGKTLASGGKDNTIKLWDVTSGPLKATLEGHTAAVSIAFSLIEVAQNFGQVGENNADVNGDGIVNIVDIILVAVALGEVAGPPAAHQEAFSMLTAAEVEHWL